MHNLATTAIIKSMWKTVGGAEQDLTPTAIEYFLDAFMTAADGHALFIKFSCDLCCTKLVVPNLCCTNNFDLCNQNTINSQL